MSFASRDSHHIAGDADGQRLVNPRTNPQLAAVVQSHGPEGAIALDKQRVTITYRYRDNVAGDTDRKNLPVSSGNAQLAEEVVAPCL